MKKAFALTHEKKATARLVDAIKSEIKKYLKRERAKTLTKDVDFWDFDCRFGADVSSAKKIHIAELNAALDQAETDKLTSCYIEIIAKPGYRTPKE
jgi:predicted nuclease of predicted toxin-antitoxin system